MNNGNRLAICLETYRFHVPCVRMLLLQAPPQTETEENIFSQQVLFRYCESFGSEDSGKSPQLIESSLEKAGVEIPFRIVLGLVFCLLLFLFCF